MAYVCRREVVSISSVASAPSLGVQTPGVREGVRAAGPQLWSSPRPGARSFPTKPERHGIFNAWLHASMACQPPGRGCAPPMLPSPADTSGGIAPAPRLSPGWAQPRVALQMIVPQLFNDVVE